MKVAQEIDVDGVTIIINPQNKLEARLPELQPQPFDLNSQLEEVELTDFEHHSLVDSNVAHTPAIYIQDQYGFGINGHQANLVKLVRLKGTNYFMFKLEEYSPAKESPEDNSEELPEEPVIPTIYSFKGEPPTVTINTTDWTYEIKGSLKLVHPESGEHLTGMYSNVLGRVRDFFPGTSPQHNGFLTTDEFYSGELGKKTYSLVATQDGVEIRDELGNQSRIVTFNMEASDSYGNTTQHNVTVEVQDDEIVVFGSGKTTSFGDPKDSYPAFFTDLFGYASSDFNYVEV